MAVLPLGATARRIRVVLAAGPLDAPGLLDALAALPDGRGAPRVARLHATLEHLVGRGLVLIDPPAGHDPWRRRRYRLPDPRPGDRAAGRRDGAAVPAAAGPPDGPLARRCHRWLCAYPRSYRRRHGTELVGSLVPVTPPGCAGPPAGEVLALLRAGLRCRLGRPASRVVVPLAAVVAGLVLALPGAVLGKELAWRCAPWPPSERAVLATFQGQGHDVGKPFGYSADVGDPDVRVNTETVGAPGAERTRVVSIRDRMRRAGWRVADIETRDPDDNGFDFTATRPGERAEVEVWQYVPAGRTPRDLPKHTIMFEGRLSYDGPGTLRPAMVGGGLLGLLIGWLLFGWFSRHTVASGRAPRVATAVLCALTVLPIGLGALEVARCLWDEQVMDETYERGVDLPILPTTAEALTMLLALAFCLLPALAGVLVATVSRRAAGRSAGRAGGPARR